MAEFETYNFNKILNEIIKKSLFTEKQIAIILKKKKMISHEFNISKGAYYRQVQQSRNKLEGFFYSMILLRGLGVFSQDDFDVMLKLSEQVSVIQNSDVFPEKEDEIISVINILVKQIIRV